MFTLRLTSRTIIMPNITIPTYLATFTSDISAFTLPDKFTYPFHYTPHPLTQAASQELQQYLTTFHPVDSEQQGRMYGVLVVKDTKGALGYLATLSGNANETATIAAVRKVNNAVDDAAPINFVPNIHQAYQQSEFEQQQQIQINTINQNITQLIDNPNINKLRSLLDTKQVKSAEAIQSLQQQMRENKKARKEKRAWLSTAQLADDEHRNISIALSRASVTDKKALQALKLQHQTNIDETTVELKALTDEIESLKKLRKRLSVKLQRHFFKQYQMLNSQGERKDLIEIFSDTIVQKPPAGSGDCAAPKLLQYAFEHQLTPLCMAEFWWGKQPQSEIRKHQHFYPACQSKCLPILTHMLKGMQVDNNPLLDNPAEGMPLEIVFQDEHIVVVNKPAGLLSVPGKSIKDSVYNRIKEKFPQASGGLIIHRLDMATSGLLMLALNERAHKHLQQQFIDKTVSKRYVATISGKLTTDAGKIYLPLRVDLDDRPKQMVCYEHGKYAETHWQRIEELDNKDSKGNKKDITTKLFLYPITGRTHQLRMHCAHPEGLNMPIVGDGLYGISTNRLHLHAQRLSFIHPVSKERLTFEVAESF